MVAAKEIASREFSQERPDFSGQAEEENLRLQKMRETKSPFPVMYMRDMLADTMRQNLGIVRDEESMKKGLEDIDYYLSVCERISYDSSVLMYTNYSLRAILTLARATMTCALQRKESRGSHFRSDHPETDNSLACASIIT